MLRQTFLHLRGIGVRTEQRLWQCGLQDWEVAISSPPPKGVGWLRWDQWRRELEESLRALRAAEYRYFSGRVPRRFHWRAWPDFRDKVAYLDIETTGAGPWAQVTVVGVFDGVRAHTFIHGDNLDLLPEFLEQFALIVTFNGSTFDLPFLRRRFSGLEIDQLHFDLRYALRALGFRGGLKTIERSLGLVREESINGLTGEDAVRLWMDYVNGDDTALELLVKYNTADVVNLEPLAEYAYEQLWTQCRKGLEREA